MQMQWLSQLWLILGSAGILPVELTERHTEARERSVGVFHPRRRYARLGTSVLIG